MRLILFLAGMFCVLIVAPVFSVYLALAAGKPTPQPMPLYDAFCDWTDDDLREYLNLCEKIRQDRAREADIYFVRLILAARELDKIEGERINPQTNTPPNNVEHLALISFWR